ncbi:hypothetical protein [Polynucleobacter sinensis]|uniref:hypothetical protein n=1 Tax=Polynucleobacter sinensis TaxID=1743157 RepID=UPI000B1DA11A|nr:hypothetical protein [Polynucleobacter sinensis]
MRTLKLYSILLASISFAACTFSLNSYAQRSVACTVDGSGKINDSLACYTLATQMRFAVYRVALCKSKPTAPTLSSPVNIAAGNCTDLLTNSDGSYTTVRKDGKSNFPGKPTSQSVLSGGLKDGVTYNYAYIESAPTVIVQTTAQFSANRTGVNSPNTAGTTCWTTEATILNYSPVPTSGSSCGSSVSNLGLTTVMLNSLGTGAAYMSDTSTSGGVTTETYLVDSTLKQSAATTSGSMGTVNKMINIQTLPITITQKSNPLKMSIRVSEGAWVLQNGGSPHLWFLNGNASLLLATCNNSNCAD